jgi:3-hydroxyisobutyrate dehydrogenase-like beta-hydroxyacid dehydrogenase
MKLVVNTLLGLGMQAIAEAIALGEGLDLPRDLLFDTLAKTSVVAPAHAGILARAKRNDYTPQFPIRLLRKDFGLILNEAERVDSRCRRLRRMQPLMRRKPRVVARRTFRP